MDFTSCRAVYLGVKAPQSDVPAPHHVLWARDQFVALCAGGIVGRCGSRSPLRVLPPEVLCHEIGRNWIMGSRCRGRVALSSDTKVTKLLWEDTQTTTWFVTVSHTLGVISIDSVGMTGRSRERARWWADRAHVIVSKWNKGLICDCEDGRVVAKLQLVTEQETKWVCSDSWGVVYHPGCYTVEMWPRGGLENSANVLNETCVRNVETPAARSEEVMWMDLLAGNQGVVSIYKEGQWKRFLLWFVDLDKSYQLGVLSVTAAFTLDSVCKGVYWSEKRGFMATQKYKLEGNFGSTYQLVALKTRLCVWSSFLGNPVKVDERHFVAHSNLDDTLRVFSTDDFDTPCRVFCYDDTDTEYTVRNGMIAFRSKEHIDLVDAVTGLWLWRLPELFHGRGVTMAPPDHVAWAEHQFVAVCAGGIVGRCASASPLRVLPHHVLCHEIGRNWIMGVAKSVLVTLRDSSKGHNEALWFVCISHTLGVVSIECDFRKISACIYGWVGRHHVATPQGFWATATTSAIVETTKMQKVAEWDGTFLFSYTVVASNRRWQLVYNSVGTKTVAIWPKPLPPATNSTISGRADFVRSVFIREVEHVQWIDATLGGSDANIVAFAVWTVHKQALWIVDLEKTYQQGVLSILQEVLLKSYDIFWSAKYGVIGAPHTQPLLNCPSQPNFMIDIDTKQAVKCFEWLGGKIDESHIYEVSSTGALSIFSATNTYTPCHVYQWRSDCRCIMDNGLIAFQGFHHVNLIDAATGCSLWSQPVPTLTPQHVLTLQSL